MPNLEAIALELLEYKVEEYQRTRQVRGGTSSMWDLDAHLTREAGSLPAEARRRFETVSQRLRIRHGVLTYLQR